MLRIAAPDEIPVKLTLVLVGDRTVCEQALAATYDAQTGRLLRLPEEGERGGFGHLWPALRFGICRLIQLSKHSLKQLAVLLD